MKIDIDKDKIRELREEVEVYGPFGHSKAFALRIDMAIALEEDKKFFSALCIREEAYAILRLFYRREDTVRRGHC